MAKLERRYVVGDAVKAITAEIVGEELQLSIDGQPRTFTIVPGADGMFALMEGHTVHAGYAVAGPDAVWVQLDGRTWVLPAERKARGRAGAAGSIDGSVTSPMTGTVHSVFVAPGAVVVAGAPLLIVEAMKMEYTITAPISGTVAALTATPGQSVDLGAALLSIEPPPVTGSPAAAPPAAAPPEEPHG